MRSFSYKRAADIEELTAGLGQGQRLLAGGTDLLPLLKTDIDQAAQVLDIKESGLPAQIEETIRGIEIGSLVTLSDIVDSPILRKRFPLLHQAAQQSATAQIRNRATLGGNLLQRPRCWYFRNPRSHCWLKGGGSCPAIAGRHEHHAIFEDSPCRAVHPSDLAACLLALGALVSLRSSSGRRELPLSDFFAAPDRSRRYETQLRQDELLSLVRIPRQADTLQSVYLKAMDRKAWAFALVGVAVVLTRRDDVISGVRIVATGVANVPRRLERSEEALAGTRGESQDVDAAVREASAGVAALPGNAYKIDLLERLLGKALRDLL